MSIAALRIHHNETNQSEGTINPYYLRYCSPHTSELM